MLRIANILMDGRVGLAPIVGSFAAGLILSRTNQFDTIVEQIKPVADVFTPIDLFLVWEDDRMEACARP